MRIVLTGGSGKAGRYIIEELLSHNHEILNLDIAPLTHPSVTTLKTDLTSSGEVFNALTSPYTLSEPFPSTLPAPPDAVIHLAGIARNMLVPENETFRINTLSTYNVIEAACKLGVKKIIIASSVTVYGVTFAHGDVDFASFPVDEEVDCNPTDTYAISKLCGERVARSMAAKYNIDIYAFRIGAIIAPEEYQRVFEGYVVRPEKWKVHGWSYTDARDLGLMCQRGLETSGLGWQVFNATNDTITNWSGPSTMEFLKRVCPGVKWTREMGEREAPLSNRKMKELLGFKERHDWRRYFDIARAGK